MHEACAGIRVHQGDDAVADLFVIIGGEGLHHDGHGPDVAVADVRAADAFAGRTLEEPGIVLAPDVAAGVFPDGIIGRDVAQIGHGEQRRDVGVVAEELVAETVHLESVDLAVFGMVIDGILAERLLDLIGQIPAFLRLGGLPADFFEDFGGLAQRGDSKEVGGYQELEDRGVVGGAEGGSDQADGLDRIAQAVAGLGVELAVGHAREAVGTVAVLALLLLQDAQDVVHRGGPGLVEDTAVAGAFPVFISETDGVAL